MAIIFHRVSCHRGYLGGPASRDAAPEEGTRNTGALLLSQESGRSRESGRPPRQSSFTHAGTRRPRDVARCSAVAAISPSANKLPVETGGAEIMSCWKTLSSRAASKFSTKSCSRASSSSSQSKCSIRIMRGTCITRPFLRPGSGKPAEPCARLAFVRERRGNAVISESCQRFHPICCMSRRGTTGKSNGCDDQ